MSELISSFPEQLLQGHTNAGNAHLTFAYPFGSRIKCVRRTYIETATSGPSRGRDRFVAQTTSKAFNLIYTQNIATIGQLAADTLAQAEIAAGRVTWNAPKASTYTDLAILVAAPLADGTGRIGISHIGYSAGRGPKTTNEFEMITASHLTDVQRQRFAKLKIIDRHYNRAAYQSLESTAPPASSAA